MRPWKRAQCGEIVERLTTLNTLCRTNPKYCTERTRPAPLARAKLSLLEASALPYSDSQKKRIIRPRPPISLSERIAEGFSSFRDGHRSSDDPHSTRDSSKRAASSSHLTQVPSVIIEPPQAEAIDSEATHTIPGAQAGDGQTGTTKNPALPNSEDYRTGTPPGGTAPRPHSTSQSTQANGTDKESTDQGSPSTTGDDTVPQGRSEAHHMNGNGAVAGKPVPVGSTRPTPEAKTPERSIWGRIFCRWFRPRQKEQSESGSQHEVETFPADK